jgi:hypothetical protein
MARYFDDQPKNQRLNRLFDDWERTYAGTGDYFVRDGIIDEALWASRKRSQPDFKQVVFLLKDKNRSSKVQEREDLIRQKDMRINCRLGPWRALGQWAYLLQNSSLKILPDYEKSGAEHGDACRATAIMNLKKNAGVEKADDALLGEMANRDAKYLCKQLDIIEPDIVLCGGVYDIARNVFPEIKSLDLKKSQAGFDVKGRLWISFYHPGYSRFMKGGQKELYRQLQAIIRSVRRTQ